MHNSYFFLHQVARVLNSRLQGYTLVSCFSQNKDELLIEFNNSTESFFLRATLVPDIQCLSFPRQIKRARKNSVDLFNELLMKKVASVSVVKNDRSMLISLESGFALLLKMHGNQSNVISISYNKATDVFRKNLTADLLIDVSATDREIDWSEAAFNESTNLASQYFTLGREVWAYLDEHNFRDLPKAQQWQLLTDTRQKLESPGAYYHIDHKSRLTFSLLVFGKVVEEFDDPLEAVTAYVPAFTSKLAFDREKVSLIAGLESNIRKTEKYLEKTGAERNDISRDKHFQVWADLLMANLHRINTGMLTVTLENIFDENRPIEVKLNPGLSPQKNAEAYYRKAKNRSIELNRLDETLRDKEATLEDLRVRIAQARNSNTWKELEGVPTRPGDNRSSQQISKVPYREVEHTGFKIWIGKDGTSNDMLTFKFGFKDDLWLHARDVSGSHVLVKHQAGKKFPKEVVERAAQLAAFFSKRKTDTLCPVTVTEKKFVRKRKGDPAGTVVIEKERVLMVEPKGI